MKKIIEYILAVPLMLCFCSCLDEHPKDQIDQEEIYNNADNIYKNAVASLYNYIGSNQESEGLQGTCRGIYDYNTLTTDEAMIPIRGGDWYDGGLWENMYQHNWNAFLISICALLSTETPCLKETSIKPLCQFPSLSLLATIAEYCV